MISFADLLTAQVKALRETAATRVSIAASEFQENWRERFGNDYLISDESGVPGTAPPLAEKTIDAREERGWDALGALYDPTLPHVDEWGTIYESVVVNPPGLEFKESARPGFYHVESGVGTDHPVFPLNEYGLGPPVRMTLLPSNLEYGSRFYWSLLEDIEAASGMPWRANVPSGGGRR